MDKIKMKETDMWGINNWKERTYGEENTERNGHVGKKELKKNEINGYMRKKKLKYFTCMWGRKT